MAPKLAGHGLQLLGYALIFIGLGVVAAVLLVAASYPAVPMWAFALGALAAGAPLMIAGGRINSRGRGQVLGVSPEHAAGEYREQNLLMVLYLGLLLLQGILVAAPLFARATGLVYPSDAFITVWLFASMLTLPNRLLPYRFAPPRIGKHK